MGVILLVFAALFTLVFVLNNALQMFRRAQIGFISTWLAFLAALVPLSALLYTYWLDTPQPLVNQGVLILALLTIVLSVGNLLIELRRSGRKLRQSRGILGIGVGLLLFVAQFSVPLTSAYLAETPESTAEPSASNAVRADEPNLTIPEFITNTPAPTLTNVPSPTMTRTTRPTASPTSTRRPFGRPTATATATFAATACEARPTVNLRMRAAPSIDAETLLTMPFDVTIPVFGRSADSMWWLVAYDGVNGWVSGEYLGLGAACEDVPVSN